MSVSYEHYKIFYYVSRYQSFSQAARVLLNSQSNISRMITGLEKELGCKLFIRKHNGVRLTEEGEILFYHVSASYEHMRLGEEELASHLAMRSKSIRIGYSIGISDHILNTLFFPVIKEYHKLQGEVQLHIQNNSTPRLISDIEEGLLDLAVITADQEDKKLTGRLLKSFQDVLVAGDAYRDLRDRPLSLSDISSCPVICPQKGTETYQIYKAFFSAHGLEFSPAIETATTDQVLMLVQNNLGIGFVEPGMFENYSDKEKVFKLKLKEEPPLRGVYLLANKWRSENEAVQTLLRMF